ncbi:hypothetical protein CYLTODRAFT_340648 [Cylindrobasidium torrendii FP15055 ss-10]|uniref:Photolyase/cryptochrome alpha/beta domain-containing protein n=1 Tax=Cylindrobasidium torrendii FP15055 ss-10 TaxID=1314674 RepID=A0A0D7BX06_9AGAR|nr:hypothetical protein CYLTODRAFT_340648 [Cylindrobasidium torrendii FP15055 ss-10]
MVKRPHSDDNLGASKRARRINFSPNKVATQEAAAQVDENPPYTMLLEAAKTFMVKPGKGDCVVYWMRMGDLRVSDNRALSLASDQAQTNGVPLVVLFTISPQDYQAHDRAARRIDFVLRNLKCIQSKLDELNIPLHVETIDVRRQMPQRVMTFLADVNSKHLFANYEYEVDELRRDIILYALAKEANVRFELHHNRCIVEPGVIFTAQGKSPAVFSPYFKKWAPLVNHDSSYVEDAPAPKPNEQDVREKEPLAAMFKEMVPDFVDGFKLEADDKKKMEECWPAGEDAALEVLARFLKTKSRSTQRGDVNPLEEGAQESAKDSRVKQYHQERDHVDADTTSRLSPYLSAGVLSIRECVRAGRKMSKTADNVDTSRDSGVGRWNQELAWRDFYTNILVAFPRVSMGRPYLEKYSDVVWEDAVDADGNDTEAVKAWKEGRTGYPIVDAGMRTLNEMGWMHNRLRMTTAMFLTKHLMIDWRVGEKYFQERLIDGDLASNNGGWQWSASTGVDPCPYFRIFNPYSQSEKADPSGDYIRQMVPELKSLKGKQIHHPSVDSADALGYARPIVEHTSARNRALRRFKDVGEV